MSEHQVHEVIVTLDGLPRPATVVAREDDRLLVRFRHAGGYEQRWVPARSVVAVEEPAHSLPVLKLAGLAVLALLGLVLLLWPGGSDKPLFTPTPTPSTSQAPSPSPS